MTNLPKNAAVATNNLAVNNNTGSNALTGKQVDENITIAYV